MSNIRYLLNKENKKKAGIKNKHLYYLNINANLNNRIRVNLNIHTEQYY